MWRNPIRTGDLNNNESGFDQGKMKILLLHECVYRYENISHCTPKCVIKEKYLVI